MMVTVRFPPHLRRYLPTLPASCEAVGETVAELVAHLEQQFPGVGAYLVDDVGRLRAHVNIFIGAEMIGDRTTLSDKIPPHATVFVMQALSGG